MDIVGFDHPLPFLLVRVHEVTKLLWILHIRDGPDGFHTLGHDWIFHGFKNDVGASLDNIGRCACRQRQSDPRRDVEARERLGDGRYIGREREAILATDTERDELSLLNLRPEARHHVEHQIDVPTEQLRQGGRAAGERHMQNIGLGLELEPFCCDVSRAAIASAGICIFAGGRMQEVDQFLDGPDDQVRDARQGHSGTCRTERAARNPS